MHDLRRPDDRYVVRAVVFTLKQKLRLIFRDLANSGPLLKWWAVAFSDRYRHLRAVNEIDQEDRGIQLKILDDAIFNRMGQLIVHRHCHSPLPFAGKYPFWTASSSDRHSLSLAYHNTLRTEVPILPALGVDPNQCHSVRLMPTVNLIDLSA